MAERALQSLKVVELSQGISGPYAGRLLTGFGAEVVKIESPTGDWTRRRRPFVGDSPSNERSALFLYLNAGKRGITLDIGTAVGRDLLLELIRTADVLIEDRAPGELESLDLGYEQLAAVNERLIITRISPFGQTGPNSRYRAGELTTWAAAGYAYLTPAGAASSEEPPLKLGGNQALFMAGLAAAIETMSAVIRRERSGLGQEIDLSIQEAVLVGNDSIWSQYLAWAMVVPTRASQNGFSYFPCKDGFISLLFVRDDQWDRMVELMGSPDWATSELFATGPGRRESWDVLFPLLSEWFMQFTKAEIVERAQARRIPIAAVNTAEEVTCSPHLRERNYFEAIDHPVAGPMEFPGAPFKLSRTPWAIQRPAPLLGEHNKEVFAELGHSVDDVLRLYQAKVL